MRGRDADNLLVFDALEEFGGGRTIQSVGLEVVDENAGVQKDRSTGEQVGINHASSCGSSSGLRATKSASSWLPVQPIKPADRRTWLTEGCTVMRTFSRS